MRSSRVFLVIFILVIALASAAGAAERDVNCWDCNSANLDGMDGISFGDLAILTTYWLQAEPEVDIIADNNMVDFNDFAILGKFWQWPCEGITAIFEEPPPDTEFRAEHYLLRASTPDCNVVRAEFTIDDVYWQDYTPYCDVNGTFELMCDCNRPGQAFECLADFTLNYLNPRDTYICLRAELFDNEGNSERAHRLVELDNMTPSAINDLTAVPADSLGDIDLTWTWPGDNNMSGGAVSGYTMKVATSPILTEGDFNNAQDVQGTCNVLSPGSPGSLGSCTQTDGDLPGYEPNSETVYYYAIKSVDDAGNVSELSNCSGTPAPWHDVTVDSIECVNAKNDCNCNDSTLENTNYLYDILSVSGYITNHGNIDETVTAELKVLGGSVVDTQEVFIAKRETNLVTGLEWVANGTLDQGLRLQVGSSHKDHKWFRVWSIQQECDLTWYSETEHPAPNGLTSDDIFYVRARLSNTAPVDFFAVKLRFEIDAPDYSIIQTGGGIRGCDAELCYANIGNHPTEITPYWKLNTLPSGTYTITITAGHDPRDQLVIERTVEITD